MFKIGEFSRLCQLPVSALRYYDTVDLFKPKQIDQLTGYRYYSADQLPRLNRLLALKELGLSLDEIKLMLDNKLSANQIRALLRVKQIELKAHVRITQAQLHRVAMRLHQIEHESQRDDYNVVSKTLPQTTVLAAREGFSSRQEAVQRLNQITSELQSQGITPSGPSFLLDYYQNSDENHVDIELAIPIPDLHTADSVFANGLQLIPRELPTAEALCLVHQGNYDSLGTPLAALGHWIESHGYCTGEHMREVYLHGAHDTSDPADYITEIQFIIMRSPVDLDDQITVKSTEPVRALSIREIVPFAAYGEILMQEVLHALEACSLSVDAPWIMLGHGMNEFRRNADIEIAVPVPHSFTGAVSLRDDRNLVDALCQLDGYEPPSTLTKRQMIVREIPGLAHAACIIHTGRYDLLKKTGELLDRWIEANGYQVQGHPRYILHRGPVQRVHPSHYITEIQMPVVAVSNV